MMTQGRRRNRDVLLGRQFSTRHSGHAHYGRSIPALRPGPVVVIATAARDVDKALKRGVLEAAARESELHFVHPTNDGGQGGSKECVTWILRRDRGNHHYIGPMLSGGESVEGDLGNVIAQCRKIGASLLIIAMSALGSESQAGLESLGRLPCDLLIVAPDA